MMIATIPAMDSTSLFVAIAGEQPLAESVCETVFDSINLLAANLSKHFIKVMARHTSYEDLAEVIRHRFTDPEATLRELFGRLTFNILVGNTDDHARNHAAFWDGEALTLTPAFDVCPQQRTGREANQAMLILGDVKESRLSICVDAAHRFLLSAHDANATIQGQVDCIHGNWNDACDEAKMMEIDREFLWKRQFLNDYAFAGY